MAAAANAAALLSSLLIPSIASAFGSPQFVTDEMVFRIAKRIIEIEARGKEAGTNKPSGSPAKQDLQKRITDVRQFILSNEGDAWHKNWLKKFGPPQSVDERVFATLVGNEGTKLGYYYIRPAPISPRSMTALSCKDDRFRDSPTMKAFCALGMWNAAKAFNDAEALARFRELARWLLANQKDGKWLWRIDVPSRNLTAPWVFCLSQSLGVSVLLRKYQLEKDVGYLEAAARALAVMGKSLKEGGCSYRMPKGTWYEEYPNSVKPSHVLNGHMWALFGIWDYYRVTNDQFARKMFDDGIVALLDQLPMYDIGYWSVYSQDNRLDQVEGNHQAFIIEQLKVLQSITGNARFSDYINRWEHALHDGTGFVELAAREFINGAAK